MMRKLGAAAVYTVIEPQLFNNIAALFHTSGDTDHATTSEQLGNLAHHRPDSSACCGNDHCFPCLRVADVEQAHVGCKARHAEDSEVKRGVIHLAVEPGEIQPVGKFILLPAAVGEHHVSRLVIRMPGDFHP